MKIKLFRDDAFADHLFGGNPAGVGPLEKWLPDATMQSIAIENNLSETDFLLVRLKFLEPCPPVLELSLWQAGK